MHISSSASCCVESMQRLWVQPEPQRFVELMPLRDVDVMLFAKQNSVLLKRYIIQCTTAINKGAPTGEYGVGHPQNLD